MQVGSYGDLDQNVSVRQGEKWQDSQYSQKVKVESDRVSWGIWIKYGRQIGTRGMEVLSTKMGSFSEEVHFRQVKFEILIRYLSGGNKQVVGYFSLKLRGECWDRNVQFGGHQHVTVVTAMRLNMITNGINRNNREQKEIQGLGCWKS